MNIIGLTAFLAFGITLFTGFSIYNINSKSKINRIFGVLNYLEAIWLLTFAQVQTSSAFPAASFWAHAGQFWPLIFAVLLNYLLLVSRIDRKPVVFISILLGYLPAIIFTVIAYVAPESFVSIVQNESLWSYRVNDSSIIRIIVMSWAYLTGLGTFLFIIIRSFIIEDPRNKVELRFIILGMGIPMLAMALFFVILPLLSIYITFLAPVTLGIGNIIISIGVMKHELSGLDPVAASTNIVSVISDAYFLVDHNFQIAEVNPASIKLLGRARHEILNRRIFEFVEEDEYFHQRLKQLSESGITITLDLHIKSEPKGSVPVNISASVLMDPRGNGVAGAVCLFRDDTEWLSLLEESEKLREELHQSQKLEALGRLAGGIAHDFNNVLGGISLMAEDLQDNFDNDSLEYAQTDGILSAASQAAELTKKLLAFSRKGKLELSILNINEIIERMLVLFEHTLGPHIKINLNLKAENPTVFGNESQLQNVFLNMCLNSRDAIGEQGRISISTSLVSKHFETPHSWKEIADPQKYVMIELEDNGEGMSPSVQKKIFDPFFTTKSGGTGLGLASAYGTIQSHNGHVELRSELGKGTSFFIYLPVVKSLLDVANPQTLVSSQVKKRNLTSKKTILVIDDEKMIRESLGLSLEKMGMEVELFGMASNGVSFYRENWRKIDLIFLDLIMPDAKGRDTFSHLQEINEHCKVVIMSGYAQEGEASYILEKGAVEFLQKPFSRKKLLDCVNNHL